jgi:hypothetical protein
MHHGCVFFHDGHDERYPAILTCAAVHTGLGVQQHLGNIDVPRSDTHLKRWLVCSGRVHICAGVQKQPHKQRVPVHNRAVEGGPTVQVHCVHPRLGTKKHSRYVHVALVGCERQGCAEVTP